MGFDQPQSKALVVEDYPVQGRILVGPENPETASIDYVEGLGTTWVGKVRTSLTVGPGMYRAVELHGSEHHSRRETHADHFFDRGVDVLREDLRHPSWLA